MMNKFTLICASAFTILLTACSQGQPAGIETASAPQAAGVNTASSDSGASSGTTLAGGTQGSGTDVAGTESAIFAGGCFWCIESDFEKLDGVVSVVSGYTGGETTDPNYQQVSYTETGHYEAVEVVYESNKLSYDEILTYFWTHIDPTDPHGQFCDKGSSYRTAIFTTPEQFALAKASKENIISTKPFVGDIVTPILPAQTFYKAEEYHQDYYKKNPVRYNAYRRGCRRDARVKQLWGDK